MQKLERKVNLVKRILFRIEMVLSLYFVFLIKDWGSRNYSLDQKYIIAEKG